MHTINANAVRGRSYENFLHENLSHESFFTRKFPDLWYMQKLEDVHPKLEKWSIKKYYSLRC